MSKGEKLTVDITNRPSEKDQHSSAEWRQHLGIRESVDTLRDIRGARDRLGQFSVRFVTEAIFGDEYARQVWGDSGGQELVRDMVIDRRTLSTLAGNVGGQKTKAVVERERLVEEPVPAVSQPNEDNDEQATAQIELLRALLKMMDPATVKKALDG